MRGDLQKGKIAIYFPSLHGGGAERAMLNLAGGIKDEGFDVDIILVSAEGVYKHIVPKGVNIIDLKASGVMASLPKLCRYLKENRPVAMLSTPVHANIAAILAQKITRVPTRIIIREAITPSQSALYSRKKIAPVIFFLMKLLYRHADEVVAVSRGVAHDLVSFVGLRPDKINIIYNPVVTKEMLSQADEPIEHPWLKNKSGPVIITAGRMNRQKDHPTLIKAFNLIQKTCNAKLIILGEGQERKNLANLVENLGLQGVVDLPGFVENPFSYFKNSSVFVLSSLHEGLPNALIQAMMLGVPVVSTDCQSGPREILKDGRLGILVPIQNEKAMADAILLALQQKVTNRLETGSEFHLEYSTNAYLDVLLGSPECQRHSLTKQILEASG